MDLVVKLPFHAQHVVAPSLKLILNRLYLSHVAQRVQFFYERSHIGRWLEPKRHQGEHTNLAGHSQHVEDRQAMEVIRKLV